MAIVNIKRLCCHGDTWEQIVIYGRNGIMSNLSPEKEFTHMMFCQQIQNVDLDTAKQLLTELHMLYLGQQINSQDCETRV